MRSWLIGSIINHWHSRLPVWEMGFQGIWNIVAQMASPGQRREILDWYHLKENLYKVGGSLKRLEQAEALLWQGQVEATKRLFVNCSLQQAHNFCQYLDKHRYRIIIAVLNRVRYSSSNE